METSTRGPSVCDCAVYTMRLVQTALCVGPAVNLPPAIEPNPAVVYYSLIDRFFAVSPWLSAHTRLWLAQGQNPLRGQSGSKFKRADFISVYLVLSARSSVLLSPSVSFLHWAVFYHNCAVAICPTSCSLFVLMCLCWCFITLTPTSHQCLSPPSLHLSIFLFSHGLCARARLASLSPPSLSYSHVHTFVHPHPRTPATGCTCVPRLWSRHGSGSRCGIWEMFGLSNSPPKAGTVADIIQMDKRRDRPTHTHTRGSHRSSHRV